MSKSYPLATSLSICSLLGYLMSSSISHAAQAPAALYQLSKSITLGSPEKWDYLSFEPESNRLFGAHGDRIDVIDVYGEKVVGHVPVDGANGVAIIAGLGKGYAGSRGGKSAVVFDLGTYQVTRTLPAAEDTDAIVYDPASKRVFLMQGDPHSITVIDTATDTVVTTIHLSGQPEFAVVDGHGKLYVNIEDQREIQRINTTTAKVDATWPIAACDSPHGLAIDGQSHRLFTSCVNSKLLVVNADNGVVVTALPIGKHTDAAVYDARTKRVFSSNGDGTLSIIQQQGADRYQSLGELVTQLGARTMALDPKTSRLFLTTGEYKVVDPNAKDLRKRYAVESGSTRVLLFDEVAVR